MCPGNRRRGQDVASLTILNVKDADELNVGVSEGDLYAGLTPHQKDLAKKHFLVTVLGKNNLHNHCLLTSTMKIALDTIIRDREDVGKIKMRNPFVFAVANTDDAFLRHSPMLRELSEMFGVKHMETKNMRKYLATTFQVMYCTPSQLLSSSSSSRYIY